MLDDFFSRALVAGVGVALVAGHWAVTLSGAGWLISEIPFPMLHYSGLH